ncbi:MAG: hypothetical protein ABIG63_11415 [Chloroflexota bacterium]
MFKKFFEAQYPAYDGRDTIPADEGIARVAEKIINGNDDLIWHAEGQGVRVPMPNRSARIESRTWAGMGSWVKVRASAAFFDKVANFLEELNAAHR